MAAIERGRLGESTAPDAGETFATIARLGATAVEEIVSSATPDTGEQVQDHDEWVVLLTGRAVLDVEGASLTLAAGDWVLLRAGTPHRVVETAPGSRWLAVRAPA